MKILVTSIAVSGAIAATLLVSGGHASHIAAMLTPVQPSQNAQSAVFFDPNAPARFIPGDQPCSCSMCCSAPLE
jgi:hypothetical protein